VYGNIKIVLVPVGPAETGNIMREEINVT